MFSGTSARHETPAGCEDLVVGATPNALAEDRDDQHSSTLHMRWAACLNGDHDSGERRYLVRHATGNHPMVVMTVLPLQQNIRTAHKRR